jgi:lysophospholipase L1-like esterase
MKALLILFIAAVFSLSSCKNKQTLKIDEPNPINPKTVKHNYSYLALGDSYTIGEAVTAYSAFPYQLAAALQNDTTVVQTPKIIAHTGWTTDDLISAIKAETLNPQYDFVTLLIGVNNQYRGDDINTYRTEFKQLLQIAITKAGNKPRSVFVLSIPDWGVTPFAKNATKSPAKIAQEIDDYNAINKQETLNGNANYLDITPISREAISNPGLLAEDGLHPSALMYSRWIEKLAPMVKAKLN